MSRLWWQLPGPALFVERVVRSLRAGQNVVLCLPEHVPTGLSQAVRSALADESVSWSTLPVSEVDGLTPADFLCGRFVPGLPVSAIRDAQALCNSESFSGRLLWIEGINECVWPAWKHFLAEYQHTCRARSLLGRTLFCVALTGEMALAPPPEDVCLTHHHWRGAVNQLDALIFAAMHFREHPWTQLSKQIAICITAQLGLFDPSVAERLAHENLARILNPEPILLEIARERGWVIESNELLPASWHLGMIDDMDGQACTHSAALSVNDHKKEISRRIWSAQVGVIFPFLEQRRQQIIDQLWDFLRVPFETSNGRIDDRRDLEFNHIEAQVAQSSLRFNGQIRNSLQRLKEIRNELAHLKPLSATQLLYEDLQK